MTTPTPCPSCGRPVPLPRGYQGGPLVCCNLGCGATFEAKHVAAAAHRHVAPAARPRPELLDRIPQSFMTSPAIYAMGAVFALLYGIVLFAVVTDWKKKRLEALANRLPEQVAVYVAPGNPPQATTPEKAPAEAEAKKAPTPQPSPGDVARAQASPPTPPGAAEPKPSAKSPAPTPPKPSAPPPAPVPAPAPTAVAWGGLRGPSNDCLVRVDGPTLTIQLPSKLHLMNPEAGLRNSPYLLTEVRGDFVASVKVTGQFRPGTEPLPGFPFPPFQGAGLLLLQDEDNYVRLERTSIYSPEGKRLHQVMLEVCRDGKTLPGFFRDARDSDITLKFDRRGSEVRCSYTSDNGRNWPEIKRQSISFPNRIKVGISASNASPRPFAPRFEAWDISGPGTKTAQGGN